MEEQQLRALLEDSEFVKFTKVVEAEVMRVWHLPRSTAHGFLMSAVGEPRTLAAVHREWLPDGGESASRGLAKLIVRRRVLDLLRGDARRPRHESLPETAEEFDQAVGSHEDAYQYDPHAQAASKQLTMMVQAALKRFTARGRSQARQADLVRRYVLDDATGAELAAELGCTSNALRVRIHKAMRALRRHIGEYHPELEEWVSQPS